MPEYFNCKIISDSMEPLIKTDEVIRVKRYSPDEVLQPYDILVYHDGEKYICHYFLKYSKFPGPKGEKLLTTRSLKDPTVNDPPFTESKILGIVVNKKMKFYHKLLVFLRNIRL